LNWPVYTRAYITPSMNWRGISDTFHRPFEINRPVSLNMSRWIHSKSVFRLVSFRFAREINRERERERERLWLINANLKTSGHLAVARSENDEMFIQLPSYKDDPLKAILTLFQRGSKHLTCSFAGMYLPCITSPAHKYAIRETRTTSAYPSIYSFA